MVAEAPALVRQVLAGRRERRGHAGATPVGAHVVRRTVTLGSVESVPGDAAVDQPRVAGVDGRPVETEPLEPARPVVRDEHVGIGRAAPTTTSCPAVGAEIHRDGALAAVVQLERRVHLAAVRPRQAAERITAQRLDLDHVGTPVGEDRGARRRRQPQAELDHPHARQRATPRLAASLLFTHRRATVLPSRARQERDVRQLVAPASSAAAMATISSAHEMAMRWPPPST